MRILGRDDVVAGEVVEFIAAEAINYARWNMKCPQHYSHGRSEVFTMSLPALEQKVCQRIGHGSTWQLQGVYEVRSQVLLKGQGFVVVVRCGSGDLSRQPRNAWINQRQLQIGT